MRKNGENDMESTADQMSERRSSRDAALHVGREDVEANGCHQPELQSKPQHKREKPGWAKLIARIGPGFLVCMAYIDPGSVQTLFQTASNDKYELLWIILLGFILVFIVQSLAANLGVATGMHLAEHLRLEYPKYVRYCLWVLAEVGVVGADMAEVIGTAFALNILLHIPVWIGIILTALSPIILAAVQKCGFRQLEMLLAMVVFVIAACFVGELPYTKPKASEVMRGFIPSFSGRHAMGDGIAFLGALIMPHNLFIHSAVVLTRKPPQSVKGINDACRFFVIESAPPLALVLLTNIVAIAVAGSICFSPHISAEATETCKDLTVNNAAFLFQNVLGRWNKLVYGISLLASAQGSALTVGCTGQFVVQGFLQIKIKKWIVTSVTRMVAIIPSLIVALTGGSSACAKLLIISSVSFLLFPLLIFKHDRITCFAHFPQSLIALNILVLSLVSKQPLVLDNRCTASVNLRQTCRHPTCLFSASSSTSKVCSFAKEAAPS